jgi:hypothetical protein
MDQKMFEEKNKKGKMEKYFLQKKRFPFCFRPDQTDEHDKQSHTKIPK